MTFDGVLEGIYRTAQTAGPLEALDEAQLVPGLGLEGDRYFLQIGTFSKPGDAGKHVTLIEAEALEAIVREVGLSLSGAESRRNLLTRGVPLNHLVGRVFSVGQARLRGVRLCEPCGHLETLTVKGVKDALMHRGGLRAEVVRGGVIRRGEDIRPVREDGGF